MFLTLHAGTHLWKHNSPIGWVECRATCKLHLPVHCHCSKEASGTLDFKSSHAQWVCRSLAHRYEELRKKCNESVFCGCPRCNTPEGYQECRKTLRCNQHS